MAQGDEKVAHADGVGAQRVVAARLGRSPVTEQIRGEHREAIREQVDDLVPLLRASGDAVDEDHHRTSPGGAVGDPVAVQEDLLVAGGRPVAGARSGGADPAATAVAGRRRDAISDHRAMLHRTVTRQPGGTRPHGCRDVATGLSDPGCAAPPRIRTTGADRWGLLLARRRDVRRMWAGPASRGWPAVSPYASGSYAGWTLTALGPLSP